MNTKDIGAPHLNIIMPREGVRPLDIPHKTLLNFVQNRILLEGIFTNNLQIRVMKRLYRIGDRVRGGNMPKPCLNIGH